MSILNKKQIILSDGAHFHLGGHVVITHKPMYPLQETVWCGLWSTFTGPYFFENEVGTTITLNGDTNRTMIIDFLYLGLMVLMGTRFCVS